MMKFGKIIYLIGASTIAVCVGLGFIAHNYDPKVVSETLQHLHDAMTQNSTVRIVEKSEQPAAPIGINNGYAPTPDHPIDFKQALSDADVKRVAAAIAQELSRQDYVAKEIKRNPEVIATALVAWGRQTQGDVPEIAKDDVDPGLLIRTADTEDGVVLGDPAATFTVVGFIDPNCPHCRETLPAALAWIDKTPKVRILFRDLPVIAPQSSDASKVAMALGQQGLYRKWLEAIADWQGGVIDAEAAREIAKGIGADMPRLDTAVKATEITHAIADNLTLGSDLKINGTPAWVIGHKMATGSLTLPWLTDFAGQQGAPLPPGSTPAGQ